jgi:hypothetical protein
MHTMAKILEDFEAFFAAHPNPSTDDSHFTALRSKLSKAAASVVGRTRPDFGRPWGFLAMDRLLFPQSKARVQLTCKAFSLALER